MIIISNKLSIKFIIHWGEEIIGKMDFNKKQPCSFVFNYTS